MAYDDMTVKDGKFFKHGKEVPIEHGNKEQIALINKINEMQSEGIVPDLYYETAVTISYDCVCGSFQTFEVSFGEDDILENAVEGETDKCSECGLKYTVFISEEEGVMLKLLPKK